MKPFIWAGVRKKRFGFGALFSYGNDKVYFNSLSLLFFSIPFFIKSGQKHAL
jgi:hypothetical protein